MFHFMLKRHVSYESCKSINSNSLSHITLRPNLIKQDENSFPSYTINVLPFILITIRYIHIIIFAIPILLCIILVLLLL